jgi:hypothetical protein
LHCVEAPHDDDANKGSPTGGREEEVLKMNELRDSPEPEQEWNQLKPVLDEAMHALLSTDREAVLLRYFNRLSLAEVGEHLGLTENAARMRVERALDKLRRLLAKRGITSTFAALSVLLTAHAVQAAPAGLATGLSASSLAAATAVTSNIGILKIMASIKLKAVIAALVTAAAVAPIVITHHVRSQQAAVDEYREQERAHLRQAGQTMTALLSFAQRTARLPDTLEEAGLAGQDYELLFKGALPDRTQAPSTIVIREQHAWRTPQGAWARVYGFADGHSQVHVARHGNFVQWENDPKRAW